MTVRSVNCKIFDGVASLLVRGVSSWLPNGPCRPSLEAFWAIGGGLGSVCLLDVRSFSRTILTVKSLPPEYARRNEPLCRSRLSNRAQLPDYPRPCEPSTSPNSKETPIRTYREDQFFGTRTTGDRTSSPGHGGRARSIMDVKLEDGVDKGAWHY